MASLHVPITEIPEEGLEFTRQVAREELLPDEDDPATEDEFTVSACLQRAGSDVVARGELIGSLWLDCDRCLSRFQQPVRFPYEGLFVPGDIGDGSRKNQKQRESDSSADTAELYAIQDDVVALGELLREQLILSLPMHPLCGSECRGLCVQCGENLNVNQCACPPGGPVSPFSILRDLVKSSESTGTSQPESNARGIKSS